MRQYECVFCDVDGTLLNSSQQILPKTKRTIQQLNDRGIPFILVSARMPCTMRYLLEEMEIQAPMICYSGALILDEKGNAVESSEIPSAVAAEIYHDVNDNFPTENCSIYRYDEWIADSIDDPWVVEECEIVDMQPIVRDMDEYLAEVQSLHKLFCMGTVEQTDALLAKLKTRDDIFACRSKKNYIEITAKNVSKSAAVQLFCERNEIDIKNIIAIGDHHNDMDMLELAGMAVAMGNAPDEVKALADMVTLSNDEEGIHVALKELFCIKGE